MEDNKRQTTSFLTLVHTDALRWRSKLNVFGFLILLFLQPGFQLSFSIRCQQALQKIPVMGPVFQKIIWYITCIAISSHCSSQAFYGEGLHFPHPCGIVIGQGTIIGKNVTIYQGTSFGVKEIGENEYPIVSDNVTVYAGAQIMGGGNRWQELSNWCKCCCY